jgi:hypothetical protein
MLRNWKEEGIGRKMPFWVNKTHRVRSYYRKNYRNKNAIGIFDDFLRINSLIKARPTKSDSNVAATDDCGFWHAWIAKDKSFQKVGHQKADHELLVGRRKNWAELGTIHSHN